MDELTKQLVRHEGLRRHPYHCPAGDLTIGVGRNLEKKGITENEALVLLENDIAAARLAVLRVLNRYDIHPGVLNSARLDALTNMAFNMGGQSLLGFRRMFTAIWCKDWQAASKEIMNSRYAKQVPSRALEISIQMEKGEYQS